MSQYAGTAKLATTIPLTDTNTPYNTTAVNAPDATNRDSIVALTEHGLYKTTLNTAKPPYPLAGEHENLGTYRVNGGITLVGTTKIVFGTSRSYRRPCRLAGAIDLTKWGPDATLPLAFPHRVQQTDATNVSNPNENLRYECDIPPGASVVNVQVWVKPAPGPRALPANRPQLIVWIYDSDAETSVQTGSAAVANAGVIGTYELRTLLTVTAGVNTIAVPQKVICQVYGEGGANYADGLIVDEPSFTFSTTQMNEP